MGALDMGRLYTGTLNENESQLYLLLIIIRK